MLERVFEVNCSYSSIIKLNRVALAVLLAVAFVLLAPGTPAQVLYGSLTGNVTDPQGGLVPGAKIEALNGATGVNRSVTSNADGLYLFNELQPGIYKITISAANFGTSAVENVRVDTNNLVRVDVQLKLKQQTESVTVTGAAPLLQTDRADVHTDLTGREVNDLPSAGSQGRNFQSLLQLIPGAGLVSETNSLAGNPERAMNTNVNGQSN